MSYKTQFPTIDDAYEKVQELTMILSQMSQFKHPLAVRRGVRKEVGESVDNKSQSKQVKGSGHTYFLDIDSTTEGKPFLRITESRKSEGNKWERNSVNVFPEDAAEFAQAVAEMAKTLY